MFHRFVVVLYVIAHFLLFVPFSFLWEAYAWNQLNLNTYQARCDQNGQLVVLEGTVDGTSYKFTNIDIDSIYSDTEGTLRFYCTYYDETKKFVDAYASTARSGGDLTKVNKDFFAFKNNASKTYTKNYTLELVETEHNYEPLLILLTSVLIGVVGGYLLMQIVRIIYQYVAFSHFNWHPYKKIKDKS